MVSQISRSLGFSVGFVSMGFVLLLGGAASAQTNAKTLAKTLPVTDYQDIRLLETQQMFAPCPTDTTLLRFAESTNYKVQICSQVGDISEPGFYMGNDKKGAGNLKFKITDQQAARQGVYKNVDYSYVIYTDGLHRDGFRPKLQVFGPKNKMLLEEQLLSLYEKDFRPRTQPKPQPPKPKPAKSATVDLTSMLPKLKGTKIPILLPAPFKVASEGQVYLFPYAEADQYGVSVAAAPDCGGANACSIGSFTAEKVAAGEALPFKTIVPLAKGLEGSFKPLTCGASCSPPSLVWIQGNVMYSIQMKGVANRSDDEATKAELVKIANSAIQAGAR